MKTTVIYHRADFDGLFCREIARKFLPDADLVGWDFGDKPLMVPKEGQIYVLDLPVDRTFGFQLNAGPRGDEIHFQKDADPSFLTNALPFGFTQRVIWIDHHATSIATHHTDIPGYRIDGVAACRLAWQWFDATTNGQHDPHTKEGETTRFPWATKEDYINRKVAEPLAVRLAGEYDIADKRDPRAEAFQFGLRSRKLEDSDWRSLLYNGDSEFGEDDAGVFVVNLLDNGRPIAYARSEEYREVITEQGFDLQFEGTTFLACNSHELDIRSQLFEAGIKPHHEGLLGFTFSGSDWRVSLYGVPHKPDGDLSPIAKKYGGGGHRRACGFRCKTLPFTLPC